MSPKALRIPRRVTANLSSTSQITTSNPPICFQCTHRLRFIQARHFASSRSKQGTAGEMMRAPVVKQPSMKAKIAHMDKSQMGDDIGRIPNTIILPAWEDYPPGLKMKAKLLWRKFTDTVVGMSTLIYAAKWDVPKDKRTGKSKRHPLSLNKRVELGLAYHSLLNTGLANGSLRGLKIMCASGLYDHCKKLIDEAKEQGYARKEWVLVSYEGIQYPQWLVGIWPLSVFLPNAHARVVSDRVVAVPFGKQSYLRECIVRIKSVQLVRIQTDRDPIIHQDRRTEHIVLQKINLDGEEGEWKVWGTIDPSKEELHDILDGKHQDSSPNSFVQEFKSRVSSLSGMNF